MGVEEKCFKDEQMTAFLLLYSNKKKSPCNCQVLARGASLNGRALPEDLLYYEHGHGPSRLIRTNLIEDIAIIEINHALA